MLRDRFKLSRGPLRWWLLAAGAVCIQFDLPRFVVGCLLVAAGTALHCVSKACLWQNRQLSTAGPYRFTRNPFYLANLAIDGGFLVIVGNPWLAAVFVTLWGVVYRQAVQSEEAVLRRLFGAAYDDYCRQTPRLWPRPWRYLPQSAATGPRLTWENPNLVTGIEWARCLRILGCPWLLAACAWWRDGLFAAALAGTACGLALWVAGELLRWRVQARRPQWS